MIKKQNIQIIFDNGGGITLQKTSKPHYMHYYNDPCQTAEDIKALLSGDNPASWEGNEYGQEVGPDDEKQTILDPSYDDIRNGGYRVYDLAELMDAVKDADLDDISWGNLRDLITELRKTEA